MSHSTVPGYLRRWGRAGLDWPLDDEVDDARLEALLLPASEPSNRPRPVPDWATAHRELSAHKGTTLALLWVEYKDVHPEGYQYIQFCELYRRWRGALDVVLRQPYHAGEKLFVDDAGPTVPIADPKTGEVREGDHARRRHALEHPRHGEGHGPEPHDDQLHDQDRRRDPRQHRTLRPAYAQGPRGSITYVANHCYGLLALNNVGTSASSCRMPWTTARVSARGDVREVKLKPRHMATDVVFTAPGAPQNQRW